MSRASELRPAAPMHPIFVHFTIALTAASVLFDFLGKYLPYSSLSEAAWWTIAASTVITLFTIASGLISRLRVSMEEGSTARKYLQLHIAIGPIFFGGLLALSVWRAMIWQSKYSASWIYLTCGGILLLLMFVQGYLGGELVYRFGADVKGVYPSLPVGTSTSPTPLQK
jgi:uncharacterized membrane protein